MSRTRGIRPRARTLSRWAAAAAATVAVCTLGAGPARADESPVHSNNGPRFTLIQVGQIDDPAEDVLEHFLLLGGRNTWG